MPVLLKWTRSSVWVGSTSGEFFFKWGVVFYILSSSPHFPQQPIAEFDCNGQFSNLPFWGNVVENVVVQKRPRILDEADYLDLFQ